MPNDRITKVTDEKNNATKYEYDSNVNIVKDMSPNTAVVQKVIVGNDKHKKGFAYV